MYKQILLAYDGSLEGLKALREGALLARSCSADVFLLCIVSSVLYSLFSVFSFRSTFLIIQHLIIILSSVRCAE